VKSEQGVATKEQSAAFRKSIGQVILDFFDKFIGILKGDKGTRFAHRLRDAGN
jgi:hypothetical protein